MKIGDYVRNKYGIAKIVGIEKKNNIDIIEFDNPICFLVNKNTGETKKERIFNKLPITKNIDIKKINISPNIIDLIEPGDYINGEEVVGFSEIQYVEDEKPRRIALTLAKTVSCLPEDIKTIVTKEQFASIEYKVGE